MSSFIAEETGFEVESLTEEVESLNSPGMPLDSQEVLVSFGVSELRKKVKPLKSMQKELEQAAIIYALKLHDGHRKNTAAFLGISRVTLYNKMRKYKLLK